MPDKIPPTVFLLQLHNPGWGPPMAFATLAVAQRFADMLAARASRGKAPELEWAEDPDDDEVLWTNAPRVCGWAEGKFSITSSPVRYDSIELVREAAELIPSA